MYHRAYSVLNIQAPFLCSFLPCGAQSSAICCRFRTPGELSFLESQDISADAFDGDPEGPKISHLDLSLRSIPRSRLAEQLSSRRRTSIPRKSPLTICCCIPRHGLRTHLMPRIPTWQLMSSFRAQLTRFLHCALSHLVHLHIWSRTAIHGLIFLSISIVFFMARWNWVRIRRDFRRFSPSKKEERDSGSE